MLEASDRYRGKSDQISSASSAVSASTRYSSRTSPCSSTMNSGICGHLPRNPATLQTPGLLAGLQQVQPTGDFVIRGPAVAPSTRDVTARAGLALQHHQQPWCV